MEGIRHSHKICHNQSQEYDPQAIPVLAQQSYALVEEPCHGCRARRENDHAAARIRSEVLLDSAIQRTQIIDNSDEKAATHCPWSLLERLEGQHRLQEATDEDKPLRHAVGEGESDI